MRSIWCCWCRPDRSASRRSVCSNAPATRQASPASASPKSPKSRASSNPRSRAWSRTLSGSRSARRARRPTTSTCSAACSQRPTNGTPPVASSTSTAHGPTMNHDANSPHPNRDPQPSPSREDRGAVLRGLPPITRRCSRTSIYCCASTAFRQRSNWSKYPTTRPRNARGSSAPPPSASTDKTSNQAPKHAATSD